MNTRTAAICLLACVSAAVTRAELRTQAFDADPNWEGVNNRIIPAKYPTVTQDFGFANSEHAGKGRGEMGGLVTRASAPAFYAVNVGRKTLDDRLSASGTFALMQSTGGSGMFFGFFKGDQPGATGRPVGSLGMDMDCEGGGARLAVRLITARNQSCGTFVTPFVPGEFRPTPIRNDGTRYTWTLDYDPHGASDRGQFTFTLHGDLPKPGDLERPGMPEEFRQEARGRFPDTTTFTVDLPAGYKQQGTAFDHFGLMNGTKPGGHLTIYFDDLRYLDRVEDFSHAPNWDGSHNRATYQTTDVAGAQNFGYSGDTHFAGGEKQGETGGTFWRGGQSSYADRVGSLSSEDVLEASGKVAFMAGSPDSGILIGWFSGETPAKGGKSLRNFIGVRIEGPTRIGHYFGPFYANSDGAVSSLKGEAPVLHPDGTPHDWSVRYDPKEGTIKVTLDKESATLQVRSERRGKATFDRFGVFTPGVGGSQVKVYIDDLKYTASSK